MKRLIVISAIVALVVGLGIAECIISTKTFTDMRTEIIAIEKEIDENASELGSSIALESIEKLISKWNSIKGFVLSTSNHAVARSLDEKLMATHSSIETGEYANAKEYASVSLVLIEDLIDETHLIFSNLF